MRSIIPAGRIGIIIAYAVIAVLFALRTPAWQAPDEPAHYNYIRQVANGTLIPVLEEGDWDNNYLEQLKSARFEPSLLDRLETIQYEDHQPPLYYLLEAPVYALTGGSLIALRLLSVIIGAGVVLCAFGVGKAMLPDRPQIALGAAAFVAFLPQHVAVLSAVDNDGLSELFPLSCVGQRCLVAVGGLPEPIPPHAVARVGEYGESRTETFGLRQPGALGDVAVF